MKIEIHEIGLERNKVVMIEHAPPPPPDVREMAAPPTVSPPPTRGQAYAKNVGWRLDYHLATPALAAFAKREHIYKDQKFSDHAPITVEYEL